MSVAESCHIPVLSQEVLHSLGVAQGGMFLDCTFGGGGHSQMILEAHPDSVVHAIDRDQRALDRGRELQSRFPERLHLNHASFTDLTGLFPNTHFQGMLADLGLSSDQLEESRGFSFRDKGKLDMRMDEGQSRSAQELVNQEDEQKLYVLLKEGGVGREARAVAKGIVKARPIDDTESLLRVVHRSIATKYQKKNVDPATVVFQALRIAVNNELEQIKILLDSAPTLMAHGAKLAVISFHSLEDKLVTKKMRKWAGADELPAIHPQAQATQRLGRFLTQKAITPGAEEIKLNSRSRSARLRVFEFLKEEGS